LLADSFELGERRGRAIDPGTAATLGVEHAPEQERLRVAKIVRGEPAACGGRVADRLGGNLTRSASGATGVLRGRPAIATAHPGDGFPAPVSPVSTVNPAPNSASSASTTAKFRIDSSRSISGVRLDFLRLPAFVQMLKESPSLTLLALTIAGVDRDVEGKSSTTLLITTYR
jgi:hypothetical protein